MLEGLPGLCYILLSYDLLEYYFEGSGKPDKPATQLLKNKESHPEVEFVPRLFLRVDAVGFGPADGPDVGLMALFEVDELMEEDRTIKIKISAQTQISATPPNKIYTD